MVTRSEIEKVRPCFRWLAGFFLLCSVLAEFLAVFVMLTEPFELPMLFMLAVVTLGCHVSGSIVFTGYAPFYLLSAHGSKRDNI